jgi:hypothetical protein
MTAILICLLAILALQVLTPFWWWIMIVPFAYGAAAARSGGKAFLTGLAAAGILWLGASLYLFLTGSGLIAARMAAMFKLGDSRLLVLATGLVAALAAGLAGYSGYAVRRLFKAPAKKERR